MKDLESKERIILGMQDKFKKERDEMEQIIS
jgi:hypothetical protein